jgi:hypothetical protein
LIEKSRKGIDRDEHGDTGGKPAWQLSESGRMKGITSFRRVVAFPADARIGGQ